MYCRNCGKKLDDDVRFCPNCGTEQQGAEQQHFTSNEPAKEAAEVVEDKPPKVWTVFSVVGKVLGIVCLSTSLIPYLNFFSLGLGIIGIVMSCLGRKAKTEETDKNCSLGLKLSIAAVAVSFVMIIIYYVVLFAVLGVALSQI